MKETVTSRHLWNEASRTGLVLGGICILYTLLTSWMATGSGGLVGGLLFALQTLLWIVKFAACLFLMRFFLLRLCLQYEGVTNQTVFGYGVRIALLSALVYSAYVLADALLMDPQQLESVFDAATGSLPMAMDANTQAVLEQFKQNYPQYMFFGNFIYCFLFGVVLSRLYSRELPPHSSPDQTADPQ
ncbi:MAG: DUF4199 domain-containing protein [Bacteroidales bacterium]|nr:DUF4199 domain-containing protein [Bacteroidales bacterium]